ncbi:anaphase-promoting complex subunit [Marssonina coronariae]|uniref:Anaphase-promoting complex subunit n=1 Tax=Diplocarpon coronariae TaxID=2795749 RepID=A0A218ZD99_9HELO|nr:anaphase-promoting complex subunit [Marssonina coronariae]
MALNERETSQLRAALQEAVVKCSERCLYQSAKWAAELLTSIPTIDTSESEDSQMTEVPLEGLPPIAVTGNLDPEEAQFEAREINQYLLAKALFDCREFDRCAAVFLPDTVLSGILSVASTKHPNASKPKAKGKGKAPSARTSAAAQMSIPKLSQKSLFLALYAKFMSGEKKKDEDSEMVMGPHDGGTAVNKQLVVISRFLEGWFRERGTNENGRINGSQGWLEYLYGMVLAKDKNEDEAMRWLVQSVHLYPMNWGCWLEMTSLVGRVEDASTNTSCLSAWTLMGHEYVELKNTHAAIESYRRAVDVNRRDYRAWYGLGQTYEVLEMHAYALWYYKRAAGLRPWDGKMWMAVGTCLQKMGRDLEGIKALKRALLADSYYDAGVGSSFGSGARERGTAMDPDILLQIAGMYEKIEDEAEARAYMEMCVAQEEGVADNLEASVINIHADSQSSDDESRPAPGAGGGGSGGDSGTGVTAATSKARMWLAKHAMKAGDFQRAMQLATELCQDGVEVEEAKALVREVRVRLEANEDS